MNYSSWCDTHLENRLISNGTLVTGVWCTKDTGLPLIVLVHGISGDFAGLVPLAVVLSKKFRIAIIELPGHGASDMLPLPNGKALQQWFDKTIISVKNEFGGVAAICAHSFGCTAVLSAQTLAQYKVILLNPVPSPSTVYVTYSRIIMKSAHFWAYIYNWPPFILLRGMTLAKIRTHASMRRVRWVGWHSRPAYDRIVYQAGLVDVILDNAAYKAAKDGSVALVVCALADTTAHQRDALDMEAVFGSSTTKFLSGGHLLPIESPERVARLINEAVVH